MSDFFVIILQFNSLKNLEKFYQLEFNNLNTILKNDIRIIYRTSKINKLSLYNSSKKLINYIDTINTKKFMEILRLIKTINNKFINKNDIKKICHLPNNYSSSHCFKDSTHQTCCLLGYKARKYSNETGNPIGKASENLFKIYFGRKPLKNDLTPWCTCIGSGVCSYYAQKFNDNTHIKFINSKKDKFIIYNIENYCESKIANEFNYILHNTPGIDSIKNKIDSNKKCSSKKLEYNRIKF